MKRTITLTTLALCLLMGVSGCVVVPRGPAYYAPAPAYVHVSYWR